jgi:signal peptidase I
MPAGTDTYEAHKIKLGEDILRAGGSIRLRVLGTSMLPSVWPGDIVSVEGQAADAVACGDIVLYEADNSFFVHRVVGKSGDKNQVQWITRGDSMPQADPAVPESHVLGRVFSICRGRRTITPRRSLRLFMRMAGWALCHSESLRSVALRVHSLRIRRGSNNLTHFARYF